MDDIVKHIGRKNNCKFKLFQTFYIQENIYCNYYYLSKLTLIFVHVIKEALKMSSS